MVKLIFKGYKKTVKMFFHNFFQYIKMLTGYYLKNKQKLRKEVSERYQEM